MKRGLVFILLYLFLIDYQAIAQTLQFGGLQGDKTLILTPSPAENQKLTGKNPYQVEYLGIKPHAEEKVPFEFAPTLPKEWNWVAIFNMPIQEDKKNRKVSFFYYDSWVGTSVRCKTSGRHRNFDNDISSKIKSNAYHIALQRAFVAENETFMLLVSPIKQKVIVELPKEIFKTQRRLEYEMQANEAKFVHIILPPDEYTVVTWQEEKQHRQSILFKNDWKFHLGDVKGAEATDFEDKNWQKIQVPHTWNGNLNQFDQRNYRDTLDITEMYKRNIGWYRKSFTVPKDWKDKYLKINFLGANQTAEVYLNGKKVGKHVGGYTDFHFGINEFLNWDKPNVLAVKVDNRFDFDVPPHTADYNFQGGIYREVELYAWNPFFIKDIHVKTSKVDFQSADIEILTTFNNKSDKEQKVKLITNLINPYNEIALSQMTETTLPAGKKPSLTQKMTFKNPQLWSPEIPVLYRIVSTLYNAEGKVIDQKSENFGFRSIEFTADKGFFLNGKRVKLKGVNAHQDIYGKAWAMDSASKRQDYIYIKKMGANFVRMSHYPHHPYELYLCDSLGLMVYPEIPVVNAVGTEKFVQNAVKMMEEMINRDKNHPAIITWGVGNEYYRETFTADVTEWALKCTEAVAKKAKELDPTRPTMQAQNDLKDERIMALTDIQGRNRYFGWYTGADVYGGISTFDGFGKMMEKEHQERPNWKILVTEYGAEGKYGFHVNNPARFDHSETYQVLFHKAYWDYISKNDWVLGGTIWNMFDFTSFAKIGNIPHINQKGTMTFDRKPKSLYYFYQSQWTDEPMIYIYSHTWTHRTGERGKKQDLEIFSNCEEVEVFLNGNSVGKRSKSTGYVWQTDYLEGLNEVKAVGYKQGETVKTKMQFYFSYSQEKKKDLSGKDSD